ncbi:hypothetical protein [Phytomonospora endophytica]|uniref:Uncharacterized protein n=1 Tax=Phytomonospora endophytica TaxID=714109 RepID=A0A841FIH4_9ACTN|nr:hypothetical protein [Phytomonospora endophytica]MBB6032449.1 hypothetical protein [Phytomonospora endophytica]GIG66404.1 hypothetical protein Pen01_26990 [Phytomonospora endophytica]
MQHARFIFQTLPNTALAVTKAAAGPLRWTLISANNRRIGNCTDGYPTYLECRGAVLNLQAGAARLTSAQIVDDRSGRMSWLIELDGIPVAESSRSYLRARECAYNLERFLDSVPVAEITSGVQVVRHHGLPPPPQPPVPKEIRR